MSNSDQLPIACIVLPTFNEAINIANTIYDIVKQQQQVITHQLYILVVDSNSPDGTQDIVKKMTSSVDNLGIIICPERGLGKAYMAGFRHAIDELDADLIIQMDSDGQHDPKLIPIFIEILKYNLDCIIGSRFVSGGQLVNFSAKRYFLSKFGNFLIRFVAGIPNIADCTSGYRCIRASLIKKCAFDHLLVSGYSFQSSLVAELIRLKARVLEFPIIFSERVGGESKLRLVDQVTFLLNLLFIRVNRTFQFIKYCLVGASGIIVNMGALFLMTEYMNIPAHFGLLAAIEVSIITNFIGHHLWTFDRTKVIKKSIMHRFVNYNISCILSASINYGVFIVLTVYWDMQYLLANFIGICCGFLANYIINTQHTWKIK